MRSIASITIALALALIATSSTILAQTLPKSAGAWEVAKAYIQKTGSDDKVDRQAFRARLIGEMRRDSAGIEKLKGTWPGYTDVFIDSVIALPRGADTIQRAALWITTYANGIYENLTFFAEKDSLWKLESMRRYPTIEQQQRLTKAMLAIDTARPGAAAYRVGLSRLMMNDRELIELFPRLAGDARQIASPLSLSQRWESYTLPEIEIEPDSLAEYAVLDDDVPLHERLLRQLNTGSLARLRDMGVLRIEQENADGGVVLLSFGEFEGTETGYVYAYSPHALQQVSKERYWGLKPVAERWWLFRRSVDDDRDSIGGD